MLVVGICGVLYPDYLLKEIIMLLVVTLLIKDFIMVSDLDVVQKI